MVDEITFADFRDRAFDNRKQLTQFVKEYAMQQGFRVLCRPNNATSKYICHASTSAENPCDFELRFSQSKSKGIRAEKSTTLHLAKDITSMPCHARNCGSSAQISARQLSMLPVTMTEVNVPSRNIRRRIQEQVILTHNVDVFG